MRFNFALNFLVTFLLPIVVRAVTEVTDQTFDEIVLNSGKYSFVKFYAEWCSHCKKMIPAFEELDDAFGGNDDVQILNLNADVYKSLGQKYGISSYPTLFLFDPKDIENPHEYSGIRELAPMRNFLELKTSVKAKKNVSLKNKLSRVTKFHDGSFERLVQNKRKTAFFAFTADWCGHCQNLKPVWAELANIFRSDTDRFLIGEVDTTGDEPTDWMTAAFEVKSYPSIFYVKDGNIDEPIPFEGERTIENLVQWVNSITGSFRDASGGYNKEAGLLPEVAGLVKQIVLAERENRYPILKELIAELRKVDEETEKTRAEDIKYYVRIMNTLIHGPFDFIETESERLNKMLEDSLTPDASDSVAKRLNVLRIFSRQNYENDPDYVPEKIKEDTESEEEKVIADDASKSSVKDEL